MLTLDSSASVDVSGNLSAPAGANVYSFQIPAGQGGPLTASLDINLSGNDRHVGFDPSLAIYDGARDLIATSDDIALGDEPSLSQSVAFQAVAGETYFAVVSGSLLDGYTFNSGDALGILPYSLSLWAAPSPHDQYGDSLEDATSLDLGPGLTASISGTIDSSGGTDFFRFTAPETGEFTVQQVNTYPDADLGLTAYALDDAQGRLVASDGPGSVTGLIAFRAVAGETYAIDIGGLQGPYGGSTEPYVAQLALIGDTFDDPTGITLDQGNGSVVGASASTVAPPSSTSRPPRPGWSPSLRPT